MKKALRVSLSGYRDTENGQDVWLRVTVLPLETEAEYVENIQICMYQLDKDAFESLTPYELKNGEFSGWPIPYGSLMLIIVQYWDTRYGEQIAAQGVWWSDGYYLRSGQTLQGRSQVFA